MIKLFKTKIGRLRIIAFLEGISLLVLVFVAVPMKYYYGNPVLSKTLGPVHGAIFLLFLLNTITLGIQRNWKFWTTTWILLSSFIPFGTFYIDSKILRHVSDEK